MSVLDDNLHWIAEKHPALAHAVREAKGGALTIVQARNGMPSATEAGRWVHSAYDPLEEAHAWAESQQATWEAGETGVVLGVGLLYHVEVLRRLAPLGSSLVVVVPDLNVLRDACSSRALGEWLGRVEWVWGTPHEMAEQLTSSGRRLRFLSYAPAAGLHSKTHGELEVVLRRLVASRSGGQLHVAVVGPIYGGSLPIARYVVSALETLGHRVSWLDQSIHHTSYESFGNIRDTRHRLTVQSKLAEVLSMATVVRLAEDPPDLVLALAQAPLTFPVLEHLRKKKFPTAMWFVENFRHLTYWQQLATGYDYWFVIQQADCLDAFRHAGAKQVAYLPMAADPAVHRPLSLTAEEREEFGSDLSFVGAGYANRRALLPRLITGEWSFKLWGNEWERAADLLPVLQRSGTRIETETCMKVFNATTVNLNLHSSSGVGLDPHADFVNPRTFELAACGAFQLVDHRTLLPELFSEKEMVTFRSTDELQPLIRTWLADSAGRTAMAEAARQRVLDHHTYVHRLRELLAHIGISQPDRIGSILRGGRDAERLTERCGPTPELVPLLHRFPADQRVELKDLAEHIRSRGPTATLAREELLILMLDTYRTETRDML